MTLFYVQNSIKSSILHFRDSKLKKKSTSNPGPFDIEAAREKALAQYSECTVGPLSSVTCSPMFMQFTGCHQPVQGFYWPENAIDWLRKC